MKIALITYTSWLPDLTAYDYVIAVDSGMKQLAKRGHRCDYWIGDFDSIPAIEPYAQLAKTRIQLPTMKDETDTHAALLFAIEQLAADEVTIVTTHSGRFDHQYAQVLLCQLGLSLGVHVQIESPTAKIQLLTPGEYTFLASQYTYLSLFAWQAVVEGLTLTKVAYPLHNVTLPPASPLGISNEIIGPVATVVFTKGLLLVIESCDVANKKSCEI